MQAGYFYANLKLVLLVGILFIGAANVRGQAIAPLFDAPWRGFDTGYGPPVTRQSKVLARSHLQSATWKATATQML